MTEKPKKKLALSTQIFIALVLAIDAGIILTGNPEFARSYIKPIGTIFLNLIKWIVCPLVFFSIMSGIVSLRDVKKNRRHRRRNGAVLPVHDGVCRDLWPAVCQSAEKPFPGAFHRRAGI